MANSLLTQEAMLAAIKRGIRAEEVADEWPLMESLTMPFSTKTEASYISLIRLTIGERHFAVWAKTPDGKSFLAQTPAKLTRIGSHIANGIATLWKNPPLHYYSDGKVRIMECLS